MAINLVLIFLLMLQDFFAIVFYTSLFYLFVNKDMVLKYKFMNIYLFYSLLIDYK